MSDEMAVPPPTATTTGGGPPGRDELGMSFSAKGKGFEVGAAARGFYAGFLLAALALAGEFIYFKDLTSHQLLTVMTGVVAGWFLGVGTINARLRDARDHIELCEREINREAEAKKRLEDLILKNARLSSGAAPIVPSGKKKR